MAILKNVIIATLLSALSTAHYANMGLDGVTCYIYNGIKGTPDGHMISRYDNGVWIDHDNTTNHGDITVINNQQDYDDLPVKTKIGIVCAPDDIESTAIGVPYVEMEPTDEEFYKPTNTIYKGKTPVGVERPAFSCIIAFCRNGA